MSQAPIYSSSPENLMVFFIPTSTSIVPPELPFHHFPQVPPGSIRAPAMAVDVASKPTLASYNIRPDAFDPKRPGPPNAFQTARDRDEAMLGRERERKDTGKDG